MDILDWASVTFDPRCPRCYAHMEALRTEEEHGDPIIFYQCKNMNCNMRIYLQVGVVQESGLDKLLDVIMSEPE